MYKSLVLIIVAVLAQLNLSAQEWKVAKGAQVPFFSVENKEGKRLLLWI